MVESDPSFKIKVVIGEIQSRFGYTISYRKVWLAKQKTIENVFGKWEASFEALPQWCIAMCDADQGSIVKLDVVQAYRNDELVPNVQIFQRVFWTFGPSIRAFCHCKPLVQVDETHLYRKYKGVLLVAVAQDGNQNILPIAFAVVEGEIADAWSFFLENLRKYVVTKDGVGLISDRHKSIIAAIRRSNGQWEPLRAFHMYCIRHIAANFLRRFKTPNLHKLIVRMDNKLDFCYSRTEHEFNIHYQRLRERGQDYEDWLSEIPREK
ncbi:uncharacterized protein LOC113871654 [Abrus precatorius]|uniref:Uncharacterized protein LOC113871654 n=1 Tax=Abrus precatorius TaxID=3816 RepID=A0A8B8M7Q1_ABRPR|nr:uncharacterized protein LOC113871654 [Abrus precatorius]